MTQNISRRGILGAGAVAGLGALFVSAAPALAVTDPFPNAPVCVVNSDHVTIKQSMAAGTNVNSTKEAQCWLNRRIGAGLAVDGKFGAGTHAAVVKFQKANGLSADGVVGPNTWNKLIYGGGSAPAPSGRAARVEKVVAFALAQQGKTYKLGAEGPTQFDCSGLTLRAYQQVGINLPRVSGDQARAGSGVSSAQRGDLLFWPGHVGIALGGGKVVHASGSQKKVVVSSIWGSPGARRLIG